jgi:hypothetical protein
VLAGSVALGAGGYMTLTGKTLCSALHGCGEKTAECTKDAKAVKTVAAKEGEGKACCALAKTAKASGGCSGAEAKTIAASAKEGECAKKCSGGKVASARRGFSLMNGAVPVAMPAMFYNKDASFCAASLKEASSCNTPCSGEGAVKAASATEKSGCCKAGKAQAVAAKDAGCCKGTGVRADGQPCKNDGDHCKKDAGKEAQAEKAGEPVAARQ